MTVADPHRWVAEFDPATDQERRLAAIVPRLQWRQGVDLAARRAELQLALASRLGDFDAGAALDPVFGPWQQRDGYRIQALAFTSEPGVRVAAWLLLPDGVDHPPLVICLQGHSSGAHLSVGLVVVEGDDRRIASGRDFALQAVRQGFAALAIEQRAFGLREDRRDESARSPGLPPLSTHRRCAHLAMTELLVGRSLVGGRVHDVRRAIDLMEESDQVDAGRIALMGQSGGGTVTVYTTALEPRIAACMPSCSFCPYKESIGLQDHCADNYLPGALLDFDMPDLSPLLAPRPLVVVAGIEDPIFPIDATRRGFATTQSVYAAAGAADRCLMVEGPGGHDFYPQLAWPAFRQVTGW